MGWIARPFLWLLVVAGLLLPGLQQWRVCACEGSWSLSACACEAPAKPAAAPSGCCAAKGVPQEDDGAPRFAREGRAPCTGCFVIATQEAPPRVGLAPLPALAPPPAAAAVPRACLPAPSPAPIARAGHGREPPGARRHRELRV